VTTVLLVDDERDLLSVLDFNLRAAGFETVLATRGEEALLALKRRVPDLVLLDLMLPDIPGTEVCRRIKSDARTKHVPVVMLTAKGEEVDRVVGFELGADDYVTKPFSPRELALRVQAILRRTSGEPVANEVLERGTIALDTERHRCSVDSGEVTLTAKEFRLLKTLMSRPGRVLSRQRLLDEVWGSDITVTERTIDTHLKRLREKLGAAGDLIETVRGVGYRFAD
jgi:two-component system phosphate regulon response regulator PhoB